MKPALSVLIINWNTSAMTRACIAALLAETRETAIEVIVVDNGSSDGSAADITRDFPHVRLLEQDRNHGFARANNIAADVAQGAYLLLLNSDTLVLDGAVDSLMHFARARPQARIWGGRTLFGDKRLNPGSAWGRVTLWSTFSFALGLVKLFPNSPLFNPEGLGGWDRASVREVDIVSGCFFLIETDFWRELNGFDPAFFMYGEEADLCARAAKLGARPACTPDATIIHYGGVSTGRFANLVVYHFGSKIGLMRRHLPAFSACAGRWLLLFATWWRASLYRLAGSLFPKRYAQAGAEWRTAWSRRAEWKDGPLTGQIGD